MLPFRCFDQCPSSNLSHAINRFNELSHEGDCPKRGRNRTVNTPRNGVSIRKITHKRPQQVIDAPKRSLDSRLTSSKKPRFSQIKVQQRVLLQKWHQLFCFTVFLMEQAHICQNKKKTGSQRLSMYRPSWNTAKIRSPSRFGVEFAPEGRRPWFSWQRASKSTKTYTTAIFWRPLYFPGPSNTSVTRNGRCNFLWGDLTPESGQEWCKIKFHYIKRVATTLTASQPMDYSVWSTMEARVCVKPPQKFGVFEAIAAFGMESNDAIHVWSSGSTLIGAISKEFECY